jgi:ElaB/YqjD/DUF883 family membrane-anchored ribosome-binding protein
MALETQAKGTTQEAESPRHQVEEIRSDLVDKLETLEHQVVGMVQGATGFVAGTVESVKESVEQTAEAVQEAVQGTVKSMRHALDVRHHVRQHPWLLLGAAFVLGFACGRFLSRRYAPGPVNL